MTTSKSTNGGHRWKMPEYLREILTLLYHDSVDLIALDKRWIPEHEYLLRSIEEDEFTDVVRVLKDLRTAGLLNTPAEKADNDRLKAELEEEKGYTKRIKLEPGVERLAELVAENEQRRKAIEMLHRYLTKSDNEVESLRRGCINPECDATDMVARYCKVCWKKLKAENERFRQALKGE